MRSREADRRDYLFRDPYGRVQRVRHFEVMAGFGEAVFFANTLFWRDGEPELTAAEVLRRTIARIAFDTLMKRSQTQLEIRL